MRVLIVVLFFVVATLGAVHRHGGESCGDNDDDEDDYHYSRLSARVARLLYAFQLGIGPNPPFINRLINATGNVTAAVELLGRLVTDDVVYEGAFFSGNVPAGYSTATGKTALLGNNLYGLNASNWITTTWLQTTFSLMDWHKEVSC
jgi:hypothetical protein